MAISLVAGLAAVGGAIIAESSINLFLAFAIGAGLSSVSRALAPKPSLGSSMRGQSIMSRDPVGTRKVIYGKTRVGGNIVFIESAGNTSEDLYLVIAIAGHEIESYEAVYFNEEKVYENAAYVSDWDTYIDLTFYTGNQTIANANLVSLLGKWTSNHILYDTAYIIVKMTYDEDKFATGLPNISCIVKGKKVLDPNTNQTAYSDNAALCIYDYLRDTKYGLGESVANIDTASINTAKTICDENVALSGSGNQARYTINGVINTATPIKDNIELLLGAMSGRLIFSSGKFSLFAGKYVAPTITVTESDVIGDITIATKQSRRSQYNVVKGGFVSEEENYQLADYPALLLATTGGNFISGKQYRILSIGNTDFTAIGASANTVGITFTATGSGSGTGTASLYSAEDAEQIILDLPLPFTTNNVRAQRLAKIALQRSRQQETISIPCNLSALRFKVGDNINISNTRLFGGSSRIFEVLGYSLSFGSENQIIVNVEARETNSQVYDWNADETAFIGAGTVNIYDGLTVSAPTNLSVTNDTFFNADGTFAENLLVNWTTSQSAFIDHYIVEYKVSTDATYFAQQTNAPPFVINNVRNSTTYDIRVKAVNELNVSSSFVSTQHTSIADTTAPAAPTNLQVSGDFKAINLTWANPTDADFSHIEIHRATGLIPGSYTKIGESSGTLFVDTNLAFGITYNYKARSVDFSGNLSAFVSQTDGGNNLASSATRVESDEITSLSVQKLSGDVTEVYPIAIAFFDETTGGAALLTASDVTYGAFTLPAPSLSISKRQRLDLDFSFKIQNNSQSPIDRSSIVLNVQKKSKSTSAVNIGTVTVETENIPYNQLLSVSGNQLEKLDISGGVATTNNASATNEPALIRSLYYDQTANKTYLLVQAYNNIFSTNDTLFFSDQYFLSSNTFFNAQQGQYSTFSVRTPIDADSVYVSNQTITSSGNGVANVSIPFSLSYGQTTTATDYRIRARVDVKQTNVTYQISHMRGTMENIS